MPRHPRHRTLAAVLTSVPLCLGAAALTLQPSPASADSVTVTDSDHADPSIDIAWAQFTNGKRAVSLKTSHPGLRPGADAGIGIDVPGPLLFTADATGAGGVPELTQWKPSGDSRRISCPDARYKVQVAGRHTPGMVTIAVPHSCLKKSGRVKMAYAIGNLDYTHWDYAPNPEPGHENGGRTYTGWISRTKAHRPTAHTVSRAATGSRVGEGTGHARTSLRHFLSLMNQRKFKAAAKFTYDDADLVVVKQYRKQGFTFRSVHACDIAPPEGYGCWATVRKNGQSRGTLWAHTDGDSSTRFWKVWDVKLYVSG